MRPHTVVGVALCLVLIAPSVAAAQDGDDDDAVYSKKDQRYKPKEGEYGGVTPGVIYPYDDKDYQNRFKRPTNSGRRRNRVTWLGYQPRPNGAARLFVQLTNEVEYSQQVAGSVLKVYVYGARLSNRNAGRRLDTHHFDGPLLEAKARHVGKQRARGDKPAHPAGVEISIRFKNAADARESQASLAKEQDDFYYLFLDFAAGTPTGDDAP